jgi:phospholipid/cholesterol/gamma-HCH transport system substrate-binding protein
METRANYALIGLFTLGVIAAAFGFVYWFKGGDSSLRRQMIQVNFTGPVTGLAKGSPVTFNGIRIGEVNRTEFDTENPQKVKVLIEVDREPLIAVDTAARLDVNLLSGIGSVALIGGTSRQRLEPLPNQPVPVIEANPSDIQDLMQGARALLTRANSLMTGLEEVVNENKGPLTAIVRNVNTFSEALANNAPGVDRFLASVGNAADKIGPLAEKLETLSSEVTELVRAVDRNKVSNVVNNIEGFTRTLDENRDAVRTILTEAASVARQLNAVAPKLDAALTDFGGAAKSADTVLKSVETSRVRSILENTDAFTASLSRSSPDVERAIKGAGDLTTRLNGVVDENRDSIRTVLTEAAALTKRLNDIAPKLDTGINSVNVLLEAIDTRKIRNVVDNVDQFSTSLGRSSGDVEVAIKEARSLAEKLNKSADRVDAVLKAAQDFLGGSAGGDTSSAFAEVREAAKSVRVLADNLDKRTAEITAGVNRVTGPTAREYEALAIEGRRTLNEISRAVRSLERNPNQVIFGGRPTVPEYNGRR